MREENIMSSFSRRDFLRMLMTLSAAGVSSYLSGCKTMEPTPNTMPTEGANAPTGVSTAATAPVSGATIAEPAATESAYLAVARGKTLSPGELTRQAISAVGGISRYVEQGADVIVKPNICNAYHGPEYASTTNPEVVAVIVAMCLDAGAKSVRVMDFPFGGEAQNAYQTSGIAKAVEAVGGQMELMNSLKYQEVEIPNAMALKRTQ